jgi:hypothetical protein
MTPIHRRIFLVQVAACSAAIATGASAQGAAKLDEADPQAVALGYKSDTTKADDKKYPKHAADQKCAGCQLYQGKPADASGPCAIFGGKAVSANGWCSAWVKKA